MFKVCNLRQFKTIFMSALILSWCLYSLITISLLRDHVMTVDCRLSSSKSIQPEIKINFIHRPKCKGDLLSIIVSSATGNAKERQVIRQSWARDRPVRFLLGQPTNASYQSQIDQEAAEFGDIVQGNFIDSYRNLTYKSIMGLMYFDGMCNANYLLKTDDDVYIQMDKLEDYLTKNPNDIQCKVQRESKVVRKALDYAAKWIVTCMEYPEKIYPDYCLGNYGAIFSSNAVRVLLQQIKLAKFLWIEDVYVTGLLRQHTNFTLVDIPSRHVVSDLSNSKSMNRSAIFWGPTSLKFNEFEIVKKLIHS